MFLDITKPTQDEVDTLEYFELTSPCPRHAEEPMETTARKLKQKLNPTNVPLSEWRKRLGLLPEQVVVKTLAKTTQFYMTTEAEERQNPRDHKKHRTPGLQFP